MAKIHLTFRYTKYPSSKLATFLSMAKSGIAGFFAWAGLFLLPLIIAGGVGSNYGVALPAILCVVGVMVVSYGCLFLIHEEKIAEKKTLKNKAAIEEPKGTEQQTKEVDEIMRNIYIGHLSMLPRKTAEMVGLLDRYEVVKQEINQNIDSHIRVLATIFGRYFESDCCENANDLRKSTEQFAFSITIYYLYDLKAAFPEVRTGDVLSVIDIIDRSRFQANALQKDGFWDRDVLIEFIRTNLSAKKQKVSDGGGATE